MIELKCIGHNMAHELGNIIHLFEPYTETKLCIESKQDEYLIETILYEEDNIINHKKLIINNEKNTILGKKEIKVRLKKMLYDVLSEYTKKTMPWGILTGIRPTKIIHDYWKKGMTNDDMKQMLISDYGISLQKVNLMQMIALKEKQILDKNIPKEINVYIGIPFCPTRCVYCSFTSYSIVTKSDCVEPYLEALFKEIDYVAKYYKDYFIRSLYVGGGTPSALDENAFERLLAHISNVFELDKIPEYTVEAGRPDTITKNKLVAMKKYGVSRISINPQSMNQKTLDVIGRNHTVEDINNIFKLARELGHKSINMDMILGLPGENLSDVNNTLNALKLLNPENITVHTMAMKRASRLKEEKNDFKLTKVETIEAMLDMCEKFMENMNMKPYYMYRQKDMAGNFENIGYAKVGEECIYNVEIISEKQSIIAVGAGSVTKLVYDNGSKIERLPNVKSLEDYIQRVDEMIERKKVKFFD
ncbi:MAG: coproporphyrinogen dehydrogenase HemZ [Cellulosilyticaceae bacterium]